MKKRKREKKCFINYFILIIIILFSIIGGIFGSFLVGAIFGIGVGFLVKGILKIKRSEI